DAIVERFDDLVCVVGEANAWPYRGRWRSGNEASNEVSSEVSSETSNAPSDELVHWVAHRVATGETFEQIIAPAGPLSPSTAFHIELAEAAILGGAPRGELGAQFARFARPTDLWCAWGHHGLDLAIAAGVAPAERLDLRAAAHRVANRKLGSLEAYAA